MEPTLLPPRESLLGEPRKTASLLFMSIGAQAQFSFDIRGAGSRSLEEKVGIAGSPNSFSRVSSRNSLQHAHQQSHRQLTPGQQSHRQPKFTQPGQQSHQP